VRTRRYKRDCSGRSGGATEVVELLEQRARREVVLDHSDGVEADPRLSHRLRLEMGPDVHARRAEHAARPVILPGFRVLGVVVPLRFILGVQVVEVAEELSKPCFVGRRLSRSPRWF
jgi:hypothetical protein